MKKPEIFSVLTFYKNDEQLWTNDLHLIAAFTSEEAEQVAQEELAVYAANHPGHAFITTNELHANCSQQMHMAVSRLTVGKPMQCYELRRWIDACARAHVCDGDKLPASYREIVLVRAAAESKAA